MKRIYFFTTLLLAVTIRAAIAQTPVPAKPQDRKIVLTGGIAHLGNGQVIQNSVVGFDNGKLTLVADVATNPTIAGYEEIKINGQHIYPGFILPNSPLGLSEVDNIRAMQDYTEHGEMNPNVRAISAYNTDSEFIPTFRFSGILLAETTPSGGLISGTSSVMELDGWNWEDAAHTQDIGIHLHWPPRTQQVLDPTTLVYSDSINKDYDKKITSLDHFFADARSYGKLTAKERNLKMDAMQGLFDGKKALFIHATEPKEIIESVRFAQKFGVARIAIITGSGAYHAADFLKENKIPVVIQMVHDLPARDDDDVDLPYRLPFILSSAGVMVSLAHNDMLGRARNLAYYAGTAVAYGMNKEEALKTITSNTAKILGIDARVGTLEVGKDATLFVSVGDAFDMRTNILSHAFIRGKSVTLPGNQEELYERYSRKFGHTK